KYLDINLFRTTAIAMIETLFVEINIPNGKNIIVGTVYRPPNYNTRDFLDKFNEILAKITRND
ncbi:unnamed protein product, partial [Porites lobata]